MCTTADENEGVNCTRAINTCLIFYITTIIMHLRQFSSFCSIFVFRVQEQIQKLFNTMYVKCIFYSANWSKVKKIEKASVSGLTHYYCPCTTYKPHDSACAFYGIRVGLLERNAASQLNSTLNLELLPKCISRFCFCVGKYTPIHTQSIRSPRKMGFKSQISSP